MPRWILCACLCFALGAAGGTQPDITELRSGLKKAEAGEDQALLFYRRLQGIRPSTPLIEGYLAATEGPRVAAMRTMFEKLITAGRSTPGPAQKNDIRVARYPRPENRSGKKNGKPDPPKPNTLKATP